MSKYFKITNDTETENGFQYLDGLNLPLTYTDITTLQHIPNYFHYGRWLREIILPKDDPDFKMKRIDKGRYNDVNKLIFGQRHSLLDPLTFKKFKLPINYYIVENLSQISDLQILGTWLNWLLFQLDETHYFENHQTTPPIESWWFDNYRQIYTELKRYSCNEYINENRLLEILDRWYEYGLYLKHNQSKIIQNSEIHYWLLVGLKLLHSSNIIDYASNYNFLKILIWWKKSHLKMAYTSQSLYLASIYKHYDILNWWRDSGFQLKYDNDIIDSLSHSGSIEVLNWWINSKLKLKYTYQTMNDIHPNHRVKVLEWWHKSGLKLKYNQIALNYVLKTNDKSTVEWWFKSGLNLLYDSKMLTHISKNNNIDLLNLWAEKKLPIVQLADEIDHASMKGHLEVLQWWFKYLSSEIKYTDYAMDMASSRGHIHILQWWVNSGLELKYTNRAIDYILEKNHQTVLKWWIDSRLPFKQSEKLNNYGQWLPHTIKNLFGFALSQN